MTPVYREKHYRHNRYAPETPKGAIVQQGAEFSLPVSYFARAARMFPASSRRFSRCGR